MIWWVAPLAAAAGFVGLCVVLRDEQRQRRATRAAGTDSRAVEARRASPTPVRSPSGAGSVVTAPVGRGRRLLRVLGAVVGVRLVGVQTALSAVAVLGSDGAQKPHPGPGPVPDQRPEYRP